jgi:ribonuclease BN (tRNA processing enzyme)
MILTILGSGTLVPHPERGTPGFAVHGGGSLLLVDGGSGTLQRCARAGVDWTRASHLLYTHFHLDHTLELPAYLFAANHAPPSPRTAALTVCGPSGMAAYLDKLLALWPYIAPKNYDLCVLDLDPGDSPPDTGAWQITCAAARHGSSAALSYRIEHGGRALVLSGDSEYCPELAALARGADLLLIECSAADEGRMDGHMSPSQVARVIGESSVTRVLINHVYPPYEPERLAAECAKLSGARVETALDLRSYEV